MTGLPVSIIMPARNAAQTIEETLAAVVAQTSAAWEVVVVDDGSTDETAAIVQRLAASDGRFRVVTGGGRGVSAARNVGIAAAQFEWLLFLDADDLIYPPHLELLTALLAADPETGVACSGWAYLTPSGERARDEHLDCDGDLFAEFGFRAMMPIHALILKKALVQEVGGFDESLVTCEDWDLWQRIARLGTRFCKHDAVQALYRMREQSASRNAAQMLTNGLLVLAKGHGPDPRVRPDAPHAAGLSPEMQPLRALYLACWAAGQTLGSGDDGRTMLDLMTEPFSSDVDPAVVAAMLYHATPLPRCLPDEAWPSLLQTIDERLELFLLELERLTRAPQLSRRTRRSLERLILQGIDLSQPATVGQTHGLIVEATAPIPDVRTDLAVERLWCRVLVEGEPLGTVQLPVCDGLVPASVLADAVAADFAWQLLGRFLTRQVYASLSGAAPEATARRASLALTGDESEDLELDLSAARSTLHDRVGWTAMLQEIWGQPDWPAGRFYNADGSEPSLTTVDGNPDASEQSAASIDAAAGPLPVEISDPLPTLTAAGDGVDVALRIGGAALGLVRVPARAGVVTAQRLRAELTQATGLELSRLAVREGVLGRPLTDAASLRTRLSERAHSRQSHPLLPSLPADLASPGTTILARRVSGPTGTSADRRAMLPAAARATLIDAAAATNEAVQIVPGDVDSASLPRVVYAPDLLAPPTPATSDDRAATAPAQPATPVAPLATGPDGAAPSGISEVYGRQHFETLFAVGADPWRYTSEYEQLKYEQTLSLFPARPVTSALELACAEGHFTIQMAPRVGALLAADLSHIALDRTARRCRERGLSNVQFLHLDLVKDEIPGTYDLIVCSEVLYYTGTRETLAAIARKMADALKPGGRIVMAHGNAVIDDPDDSGFEWGLPFGSKVIGEVFAATEPLRLAHEIRTPLYRVQAFERPTALASLAVRGSRLLPRRISEALGATSPTLEQVPHAAHLPPDVAAHARWPGDSAHHERFTVSTSVTTESLPILMYHRVADSGPPALDRYRITPAALEEQLRYLRDAGYVGVTLQAWHAAMTARRPLPGRAILLTFDDGYLDFSTHAWPLLQQYGFSATMFLVADRIGGVSEWDAAHGEPAPLMGWPDILKLQAEGIEFGSHSCTHPPLTALSPEHVTLEAARARAILTRGLRRPVTAFAYPYGDQDAVVRHLTGACGYTYGLTCDSRLSSLTDDPLALPRLEITGADTLATFVAKLAG